MVASPTFPARWVGMHSLCLRHERSATRHLLRLLLLLLEDRLLLQVLLVGCRVVRLLLLTLLGLLPVESCVCGSCCITGGGSVLLWEQGLLLLQCGADLMLLLQVVLEGELLLPRETISKG